VDVNGELDVGRSDVVNVRLYRTGLSVSVSVCLAV